MDRSDAWVLKSIRPGAQVSLTDIVEAADLIMVTSILEAELSRGVGRLFAVGLMAVYLEGDRYWLTKAGRTLSERNPGPQNLDGVLSDLCALGPPPQTVWVLPDGHYARAAAAYHRRMRAFGLDIATRDKRRAQGSESNRLPTSGASE